jgi:hypothetical protein
MKWFILGPMLSIVIMIDYMIMQSDYHIVPEEWFWIALVFYLLGALTGLRAGTMYSRVKFNAILALGMVIMFLFRALTDRQWAESGNLDLDRLAMRITVMLVFNIFTIALMGTIYWGYDRWERARADAAAHAPSAPRSGE